MKLLNRGYFCSKKQNTILLFLTVIYGQKAVLSGLNIVIDEQKVVFNLSYSLNLVI